MGTRVRVLVCSALTVEVDGVAVRGRDLGSRKARTLLALLAAERGRLVPVDRIVDVLWPDGPPADPAANVSTLVSRSRRLLGDALTTAPGRAHGLVDGDWSVDLDEASALLDDAAGRRRSGEHGLAAAGSRRALDLLGAPPALLDEADADWVRAVRGEADALRARARHLLAASLTSTDPPGGGAGRGRGGRDRPVRRARGPGPDARPGGRRTDGGRPRDVRRAGPAPASGTSAPTRTPRRPPCTSTCCGRRRRRTRPGRPARRPDPPWSVARGTSPPSSGPGGTRATGRAGWSSSRARPGSARPASWTRSPTWPRPRAALVLRSRCHPTERSLFLQPYVDALRPALLHASPAQAAALVRGHEDAWSLLLPDLGAVVGTGVTPRGAGSAELQRRRAYDAVASALRTLARRAPVLLALDDLQDAGVGHGRAARLPRRAAPAEPGCCSWAPSARRTPTRSAGSATAPAVVRLGALPRSAVDALAAATGLGRHGATVMARTAGHTLSVVECLRALAAGDPGVPATLAAAVLARVDRLDPEARDVLRAAAVLGRRLDPRQLAMLGGWTELEVVRQCEELARVRLLVVSDRGYDFVNDLVQECVHASLPPALSAAYHRRAADLTADQPELMAEHAFAAGDADRAAHGWLLAGEAAMRRGAVDDAHGLFDRGCPRRRTPRSGPGC